MISRAIVSSSLVLENIGHIGNSLCWAEVANVLSLYYYLTDDEPVCDFICKVQNSQFGPCCDPQGPGGVAVGCDKKGDAPTALRFKKIGSMSLPSISNFWAVCMRELSGQPIPRPLLLLKGPPGARGRHAELVNGFMNQGGRQGLETLDPRGSDHRNLYAWDYLAGELQLGKYEMFLTAPRAGGVAGLRSWIDTPWSLQDLEGADLSATPYPPVDRAAIDALVEYLGISLRDLERKNKLVPFQLEVSYFLDAEAWADIFYSEGVRFILSSIDGERVVIADAFLTAANGQWQIGRLSTGALVKDRVASLRSYLETPRLKEGSLRFVVWPDIGLDVALINSFGPAGDTSSEEVILMGARTYLDLESSLPSSPLGMNLLLQQLRETLEP